MKRFIGQCLLASPFIGHFAYMWYSVGLLGALMIYGAMAVLFGIIALGVHLTYED